MTCTYLGGIKANINNNSNKFEELDYLPKLQIYTSTSTQATQNKNHKTVHFTAQLADPSPVQTLAHNKMIRCNKTHAICFKLNFSNKS